MVALQQVLAGATLDPVVATISEDGVGALTGDDEVVAGAGEGLVVVLAAVDEVAAVATHEDVVADASIESVVARAALQDVPAPLAVELVGDALLALSWLLLFRSFADNTSGSALVLSDESTEVPINIPAGGTIAAGFPAAASLLGLYSDFRYSTRSCDCSSVSPKDKCLL